MASDVGTTDSSRAIWGADQTRPIANSSMLMTYRLLSVTATETSISYLHTWIRHTTQHLILFMRCRQILGETSYAWERLIDFKVDGGVYEGQFVGNFPHLRANLIFSTCATVSWGPFILHKWSWAWLSFPQTELADNMCDSGYGGGMSAGFALREQCIFEFFATTGSY